jgi:OOP family OmpA-OmpF porin
MQRHISALMTLALLGFATRAQAQERGYAINHFDLSERGSEWFSTDSLDLRGRVRPALGVVGEWAFRPLVLHDAQDEHLGSIVRNQFVLHPGISLVLFDRLRLAADMPVQAYADGFRLTLAGNTYLPPSDKTSLGDLRLGVTLRLFGIYGEPVTGALGVQVALPTGSESAYAGDGDVRVTPHFMLAGDVSAFVYAFKAGVTIRAADQAFGNSHMGSYASVAASMGVRVANKRLVIGPEYFARSVLTRDQFFKRDTTPMEAMLGLHWTVVDGLRLGAGLGIGLTSALGSPQRRGLLSLEWTPPPPAPPLPPAPPPDRDQDFVLDFEDACPDEPGERTADRTTNGCPPPADRDHDGVLDLQDACPDEPGNKSDDPKTNGCPPPPDRDQDGILDADDACPDQAGNADPDPQRNGCPPPPDRDKDTVLDADDACPDQAGKPDSNPKRNGCPMAYVMGKEIKILDQVKFKTNSAKIVPGQDSEDILYAVLQILNQHPEVTLVLIEGHTDSKGKAARNRVLSKQRAQSVANWLIKSGTDRTRLTTEGIGPDRPIDTNDTDDGRRNNRRVEFHIVNGEPVMVPVQ